MNQWRFADPRITISVLLIALTLAVFLPVGWLWYLVTLLPVIGLVQVGEQTMADRYTYVPLIGLFVMIAWLVPDALRRVGEWGNGRMGKTSERGRPVPPSPRPRVAWAPAAASVVVLAVLSAAARIQVGFWKDSITLFEHTVAVTTDNYTGYVNLGLALSDDGQFEPAIEAYQNAARILPNECVPHTNLAVLFYNTGRYAEAWKEVHTSRRLGLELNPQFLADLALEKPEPPE